ncbi:MAG: ATP-dependent DNA helicase RecG, partial [Myxococcales bacterium]
MSITWDSPVTTVVGKQGRKLEPLLQKKGIETVGDLLRFYPRAYVPKGRLSELGQLVEGTMVSLVGEIVRSSAHEYRDRRTGRIAYRLEVVVQYDEGRLLMTYFDRQKHTAEWRARLMARG